ncbi:hypothetical protein SCANM63S_09440 [Streptomyces canarius]
MTLEGLGDGRRGVVGGLTADERGHPGGRSAGTGVRLPAARVETGHGGALAGERHAVEPLPYELDLGDDLGVGGRLRVDEGGDGLGGQFGVALPQQVPQDGGGVPHAQFAGERGLAQRFQMGVAAAGLVRHSARARATDRAWRSRSSAQSRRTRPR